MSKAPSMNSFGSRHFCWKFRICGRRGELGKMRRAERDPAFSIVERGTHTQSNNRKAELEYEVVVGA